MSDIEHGTYAGYNSHLRLDVPMTDECGCAKARNAYMQEYRNANPDARARQQTRANLRRRALNELAERHQREFQKILKEMS